MRTALKSEPTPLRSTVFQSGNSQAVRIPKEFQFNTKLVSISREGDALLIRPQPLSAAEVLADLPPLPQAEALALDAAMALRRDLPELAERDLGFENKPATTAKRSTPANSPRKAR
ncbi:MAG: hypothetical protein RL758_818 [Pseudomonadota bacterium]|jgi:virulence-associated protein VagC